VDLQQSYKEELLSSIPVISGMDVDIIKIEEKSITLTAPLNTNINYEGTAFGGSLNTLCILSSYLLVHHALKSKNIPFSSLVIQDSSVKYLSPVHKDFKAQSIVEGKDVDLLVKLIDRKGVGRISVKSEIKVGDSDEAKVVFQGRFVASR
jgi:thioesterase domain-containing protein